MRDPDISFDLDALKLRFRIADIIDETEPQYDFSALFAEHPSDMIGFYIQALKKPDMSPVEKKALFYGIHALLLTTDEGVSFHDVFLIFISVGLENFMTQPSPLRTG